MAGAFTLTLTHLAERCEVRTANALAAYVTGVVASNLIGRLTAAFVASLVGPEQSFLFFALLNLAGAALVSVALHRNAPEPMERIRPLLGSWGTHIADPALRRTFAIGFLILFGFIGVFTYVGFVLMTPPHALSMTALGLVFLVFLPSMITTPMAGTVTRKFGPAPTATVSLIVALLGLALLLVPSLLSVIARNDARRDRHVLRSGRCDGPRRPHRQGRQGRGQRSLSVILLLRRSRRRGRDRTIVRPAGMVGRGDRRVRLARPGSIAKSQACAPRGCAMSERYRRGLDVAQQLSLGLTRAVPDKPGRRGGPGLCPNGDRVPVWRSLLARRARPSKAGNRGDRGVGVLAATPSNSGCTLQPPCSLALRGPRSLKS